MSAVLNRLGRYATGVLGFGLLALFLVLSGSFFLAQFTRSQLWHIAILTPIGGGLLYLAHQGVLRAAENGLQIMRGTAAVLGFGLAALAPILVGDALLGNIFWEESWLYVPPLFLTGAAVYGLHRAVIYVDRNGLPVVGGS